MALRFSLWFSLVALGLTACQPDLKPGPLVDLIGSSRYISSDRINTVAGDTVTYKLFTATARDTARSDARLQRVVVSVTYSPRKEPILYQTLPENSRAYPYFTPGEAVDELVLLDTAISRKSFAYQATVGTRTTSGRETWKFESWDADHSNSARFRLTLRNADSTLLNVIPTQAYHSYTVRLQAPRFFDSRPYLSLLTGLTFTRYAGRTNPKVQQLVDLIHVRGANNAVRLFSPAQDSLRLGGWVSANRRATQLAATTLTIANFGVTNTTAQLTAAFTAGTTLGTLTPALQKGQVLAFRTQDNKYGLIYVQDLVTTPVPTAILQVRVTP